MKKQYSSNDSTHGGRGFPAYTGKWILRGILLLCLSTGVFLSARAQQAKTITGVVRDDAANPLPGVGITAKGFPVHATTNDQGRYRIDVPANATTLVFTYIGKETREIPLTAALTYDVILLGQSKDLSEVVISTGYMTQRKADLTGAITVINRSDFAKNPSANVMRSMQGKIPGLYITTDGNPAENVGIQVRGITSINSSPPLIVLDGQPVNINLRDINPNDIESMQVLKDAASASIYGSRAAGGVILINTRRGKSGETRVTYESYVGVSKITGVPDMLDANGYGRALWQATVNDGDDPAAAIRIYKYDWNRDKNGIPVLNAVTPVEWLNADKTMPSSNTNWFKEGTRTGIRQNHQITITGGKEHLSSLFSFNYYDNQGTQITSSFRRYSARFNNEYEMLKGRLTIGENFTMTNLRIRDINSTYGFLVMPPNIPVYDNNGGWGGVAMALGMDDFNNPVRDLEINKDNKGNFLKILGTGYANLKILDNLAFKTQFGLDYNMWYDRNIEHKWKEAGGKSSDINGVRQNNWQNIGRTWTNTLIYNLKFGKNLFDILGGIETYRYVYEFTNAYRNNILLESRDYAYLSAATGDNKSLAGGGDERTLLSFFGKINYSYESKYLLSATIRRDGSSVFGENNRYSTFPAFSAGWRISQEPFLKNAGFLNDLKLRASWGQNGNSAPLTAGSLVNIYLGDFDGTAYAIGGNQTGSIPSGYRRNSLGNPDLKWETTTQTNIGADFSFLDDRLSGSFDWFNKKTTDMLFQPPYIGALGEGGYRWVNAADMTNQGYELLLSWGEKKREFTYRVTANVSAYKNKINSIPENVKYTYGGNGLLDNIIGRPLNSFYGLVADGIFKTQEEVDNSPQQQGKGVGRIRYKDLDGDGVINETYDRTWIGVRDPKLMAGLNLEATYKNWDITIFVQGVFGNSVYNNWKELSDFWNIGVQNDRNHPSRILEAWSPSNPNSDIPALSRRDANGEKRMSTYFIEDGSYIKLRTVDIGYTLPNSLMEKWHMNRVRVYISGQNLLNFKKTWGKDKFTGGDPENPNEAYPLPVNGLFGLNVTF
ncbi:TonB-dependent receptor [Chitinophaga sp.]|uniref:SusC/RagA family TonB-linked outer membrane protein n=1 Tax=Chitinophaga sp. TaxID=1869181 RepID=UPI002C0ED7CD|nr:TonB-dependent receptor [Chitinophaga sp.]HWV69066.1 TonB-dependent receptor [Chitinophaga sp.]